MSEWQCRKCLEDSKCPECNRCENCDDRYQGRVMKEVTDRYEEELAELREAGNKIISAIRYGLSQDELEAMEEFELLQEKGE